MKIPVPSIFQNILLDLTPVLFVASALKSYSRFNYCIRMTTFISSKSSLELYVEDMKVEK